MSLKDEIRAKLGKKTEPKEIKESTPKRTYVNKTELKNELRKLIHTLGSGHRLYKELGYSNIIDVKARIQEIIDKL